MQISTKDWTNYIGKLRKLSNTAADKMQQYVQKNGFGNTDELIEYAYALATKYGEGSAELACQMYDAVAEMSDAAVEAAVPAATATYAETARAVQGSLLQSPTGQKLTQIADRLVKQAAADTLLHNAIRDQAQWAWIPSGDTCSFCLVLASRGWQYASKSVLKGDHAQHIHANCDCMFQIRFDSKTNVAGYDPDKLREQYYAAEGNSSKAKINSLRRASYAKNKEKIKEQKKEAYSIRNEGMKLPKAGLVSNEAANNENPFLEPQTPLTINNSAQNVHVVGTKEYENRRKILKEKGQYGPSFIEISESEAQELVDKYHGHGKINSRIASKANSETILDNDKVVGTVVDNRNGNSAKTTVFKIHYAKDGTHIVPDYPSKKK